MSHSVWTNGDIPKPNFMNSIVSGVNDLVAIAMKITTSYLKVEATFDLKYVTAGRLIYLLLPKLRTAGADTITELKMQTVSGNNFPAILAPAIESMKVPCLVYNIDGTTASDDTASPGCLEIKSGTDAWAFSAMLQSPAVTHIIKPAGFEPWMSPSGVDIYHGFPAQTLCYLSGALTAPPVLDDLPS